LNPGQKNIHEDAHAVIEALEGCSGIFVNKDEAMELVHKICKDDIQHSVLDSEKYLLQILSEYCSGFVSITDGKRGVWVQSQQCAVHAKPEVIENAVDSTGAGDSFTSGFLAAYSKGSDLEQCVSWGIANARNVIQYYGAKKGLLREDEIQMPSRQARIEAF